MIQIGPASVGIPIAQVPKATCFVTGLPVDSIASGRAHLGLLSKPVIFLNFSNWAIIKGDKVQEHVLGKRFWWVWAWGGQISVRTGSFFLF